MAEARRVTMELKEQIAVLADRPNGWTKELNLVSWNGNPPKYDIRDWDQEHVRVSKGLTLFDDEMRCLVDGYLRYRNRRVVANGNPYRESKADLEIPASSDAASLAMHSMEPGAEAVATCAEERMDRMAPAAEPSEADAFEAASGDE